MTDTLKPIQRIGETQGQKSRYFILISVVYEISQLREFCHGSYITQELFTCYSRVIHTRVN